MSVPVAPARPLDPRLTNLPETTARKLAQLPTSWLDQLLEGTK